MDVDFIRAKDAIISNGYNDRPLSWHFRALVKRGSTWNHQDFKFNSQ